MKVLIISQYFWPEDFRINELVREIIDLGYEVDILTGRPNYPEGEIYPQFKKDKKKYSFFHGHNVYRCWVPARGKNKVALLLNYFLFVITSSVYAIFLGRKKKYNFSFVFEPSPITVCLPAIVLKKIFNTPIIFWVLDLWPQTLHAIGIIKKESIITKLITKLVIFIYQNCNVILGQSNSFVKEIKKLVPDHNNVLFFPNWVESSFEYHSSNSSIKENLLKKDNSLKVCFAGNIGEAQDFKTILDGIKKAQNDILVELHIYGSGRYLQWVRDYIKFLAIENIVFLHGRMPQESMYSALLRYDALLVSLKNDENLNLTIPGKLQTYMSIGKPILGIISGEGALLINQSKSGLVSRPGDSDSFYNNLIRLHHTPLHERELYGINAIDYSNKNFSRKFAIDRLIEAIDCL